MLQLQTALSNPVAAGFGGAFTGPPQATLTKLKAMVKAAKLVVRGKGKSSEDAAKLLLDMDKQVTPLG